MPATSLIEVTLRDGSIHLPGVGLWLDPRKSAEAAFISHAHSDHVARHGWTLCSALTRQLMETRYGRGKGEVMTLEFGQPFVWQGHVLKLLPAGHILGSAMLHVTRQSDGATLLYTGDYKLRQGLTAPLAQLLKADTLIMETTFGLPRFTFPPMAEIVAALLQFVRETRAASGIPVLLGYSLGKAQEILAALRDAGAPVMLHSSAMKLMPVCAPELHNLPEYQAFDLKRAQGHVLILPPAGRHLLELRTLTNVRTAMLTGWALLPGAKYRYRVDEVFPFSDHADYPELLETVAQVQPRCVFTVHGYTREFAADLRRRGHESWALGQDNQLELRLETSSVAASQGLEP